MRVGRRRAAVVAGVLVALTAGTGVARAYYAPGAVGASAPQGYFSFCGDRQRDIAGITPEDLTNAGYSIDNYVSTDPGPVAGERLPDNLNFVRGKSGIDGVNRRVVTTQWVEYDSLDVATRTPVQIRCKLRTRESLLRSDNQRDQANAPTSVPWGFGPEAATQPGKTCLQVQEDLVKAVSDRLVQERTEAEEPLPPFVYGTPSVVFDAEVVTSVGPTWLAGTKTVTLTDGVLHIGSSAVVNPSSDSTLGPDRFYGAHYCVFVAPEYIRSVLLGGPVY